MELYIIIISVCVLLIMIYLLYKYYKKITEKQSRMTIDIPIIYTEDVQEQSMNMCDGDGDGICKVKK